MIVRVNWNSLEGNSYHVYEAHDYFVKHHLHNADGKFSAELWLDTDKHHFCLSGGDEAYIMNNDGKTIDTIRT